MRRTRSVVVVLAFGILGSLVVAPAAEAAKPPKPHHPDLHLDCAHVAEKVAKLEARRAREGERHGRAGADGPKAAEHLARIDDEIARAQAACI